MGVSLFTNNSIQVTSDGGNPITDFDHDPAVVGLRRDYLTNVLNNEAHEKRLAAMTPEELQGQHGEYQSVLDGTHAVFKQGIA